MCLNANTWERVCVCVCVHRCVRKQTLFMFLSWSEEYQCKSVQRACSGVCTSVHVSLGVHVTCVIRRDEAVLTPCERDDCSPCLQLLIGSLLCPQGGRLCACLFHSQGPG